MLVDFMLVDLMFIDFLIMIRNANKLQRPQTLKHLYTLESEQWYPAPNHIYFPLLQRIQRIRRIQKVKISLRT